VSAARTIWGAAGVLLASLVLAIGLGLPHAGAQDTENDVLRVGWGQDPRNLNPFTALDEENYNVWALNWDLLVNFSPEDLSPAPGIAESWDVSEDRQTITFHLFEDARWSDGEPITSEDVKWSYETLGEEGQLFTNYTSNVTSIETPDEHTVVINTRRPDARIVGGIFVYILPKHIWGKVPIDELTGSYKPELPLVGSGPYVVTEFEPGRIVRMERNPNFRGPEPAFEEIQYIKYGTQDAAERALQLGEVDLISHNVQAATFDRLGEEPNIETVRSPAPEYTELAFNLCPERYCPDAQFNPAVQDLTVRQAIAHAIDRERIVQIVTHDTSFAAHGILPAYYKSFYEVPAEDYPYDPELANQMLDEAGWVLGDDGVRTKDGEELSFDLYARSESQFDTQIARLVAEQGEAIGVEFKPQIVSTDKLTELTIRHVDGKPAPEFDTFIWGWGGDPYDPSFLLSLFLTSEIGGLSDSFYSNPEYDRLFQQQAGVFDVEERKALIQEMVAITQRDLPYIVLTYDPLLQAYRSDTIDNVELACPAGEGDILCTQTGYAPLLSITPAEGGGGSDQNGGQSPGLAIVAAFVFGVGGWLLGARQSRRREAEPLELPE
jgi:peptide/nickel transport system substrate-binding protein